MRCAGLTSYPYSECLSEYGSSGLGVKSVSNARVGPRAAETVDGSGIGLFSPFHPAGLGESLEVLVSDAADEPERGRVEVSLYETSELERVRAERVSLVEDDDWTCARYDLASIRTPSTPIVGSALAGYLDGGDEAAGARRVEGALIAGRGKDCGRGELGRVGLAWGLPAVTRKMKSWGEVTG